MSSFDDFTEDDKQFFDRLKSNRNSNRDASERKVASGAADNFSNLSEKASNLTKAIIAPAMTCWLLALSIISGCTLITHLWFDWMPVNTVNLGFSTDTVGVALYIFLASTSMCAAIVGIDLFKVKSFFN